MINTGYSLYTILPEDWNLPREGDMPCWPRVRNIFRLENKKLLFNLCIADPGYSINTKFWPEMPRCGEASAPSWHLNQGVQYLI